MQGAAQFEVVRKLAAKGPHSTVLLYWKTTGRPLGLLYSKGKERRFDGVLFIRYLLIVIPYVFIKLPQLQSFHYSGDGKV